MAILIEVSLTILTLVIFLGAPALVASVIWVVAVSVRQGLGELRREQQVTRSARPATTSSGRKLTEAVAPAW